MAGWMDGWMDGWISSVAGDFRIVKMLSVEQGSLCLRQLALTVYSTKPDHLCRYLRHDAAFTHTVWLARWMDGWMDERSASLSCDCVIVWWCVGDEVSAVLGG
mmetsp:Transcript_18535/g.52946  ORF Transcript_18535/g.52946 Transcript_18535/m.52946 type:complete len:103 (-) Transcript_18535:319-627(-)